MRESSATATLLSPWLDPWCQGSASQRVAARSLGLPAASALSSMCRAVFMHNRQSVSFSVVGETLPFSSAEFLDSHFDQTFKVSFQYKPKNVAKLTKSYLNIFWEMKTIN